ncbi:Serine carboxypeptidase-like 51 [Camellia lanceoleosa]|uniref:Serine carboxypeptidase-like 51 n=1 Tax=Camellia lanceoleosa TaxID=1840588 RepID=A0ACC0F9I7_9ERIC|nr:Serine carboxypeptidase-like 51 [Camellia lanceoleosa]
MASMKSLVLLVSLFLLVSNSLVLANFHLTAGTDDEAHMFWWLYRSPYRVEDPSNPWPTILWLQGGPGGSRVGFGNFLEIGPLDVDLKPWNSTWLTKADLLLVDSPVGTRFNYVEDESLAVKTDEAAAIDLTAMLKALFNGNETLQKSPLFIIVESYGGKFAFSWGPLLKDLSRLDSNALYSSNSLAQKIQQELAEEKYEDATNTWGVLEDVISASSNDVDFYNFMLDSSNDPLESRTYESKGLMVDRYLKYMRTKIFSSINSASGLDLYTVMNGPIKQKLKIIPENVTWDGQGAIVFPAMVGDFMKPRIKKVDKLLAKGVNVTIYNGQIDLIYATKGTEAWIDKLE